MFCRRQVKLEGGKKQDVMTLSDSDDVQTISSGSEENKDKKPAPGKMRVGGGMVALSYNHHNCLPSSIGYIPKWDYVEIWLGVKSIFIL